MPDTTVTPTDAVNATDTFGLADRVLYRDGLVLVVDKPAGIAVHRSARGGRVLEDGFGTLRFGLPNPPGLAHRLDKDTAGCLVLGRHRKALALLGELFATGAVKKTYWAVVVGAPPAEEGVVAAPLAKRVSGTGWSMAVDPRGQAATTRYRTLGRGAGLTWLELTPETGRTHQLRVHCAHLGVPMLGDPIYGRAAANGPRLQLLARAVALPLSRSKPPVEVVAPVPDHMRAALVACGARQPDVGGAAL